MVRREYGLGRRGNGDKVVKVDAMMYEKSIRCMKQC
jgi:hypothetical protein